LKEPLTTACIDAVTFAGPRKPANPWRLTITELRAHARGPKNAPLQPE
jgi:hypothetical protein